MSLRDIRALGVELDSRAAHDHQLDAALAKDRRDQAGQLEMFDRRVSLGRDVGQGALDVVPSDMRRW